MKTEHRVVDNRIFLLGLDELYREKMKTHERGELLLCAQETARVLSVDAVDVPIEGYYSEDDQLTEYFRLVRALQKEPKHRESELVSVDSFTRLKQVTGSPIFGPPFDGNYLLTVGEDALSIALTSTFPEWNIEHLTNAANQYALESDDFSLVALAALSCDSVVLAALRESVVLYAMVAAGAAFMSEPEYIWKVDDIIQSRAQRFVSTFNALFNESLPEPSLNNAATFWNAYSEWKIVGRCVRIGYDNGVRPIKHYHWALDHNNDDKLIVKDFWDTDIWTTQRYREKIESCY